MKKKKINIVTLGCSKNVVDSEKLLAQLKAGGHEIIFDSGNLSADTVIINTCGFINDAKEESIDTILQFIRAKEAGKIRNLYVMGCLSERYMDALKTEIPEVSRYFGVNNIREIVEEIGTGYRPDLMTNRVLTNPGHYAYLKVSEGCDRTCAFCAIPAIRGKCVSRTTEEIMKEAEKLAASGVREIILIAQDLSYYGLDLYKKQMLPELVSELLGITEFEWIRLHYLYPANFPEELIPLIRENPRICRYIDIPLQHISDKILSLMNRSHDQAGTIDILNKLRKGIPGAAIRTTLIAGHPGETDQEFNELKEFVREFRFDRLGVFAYSHEEGTPSFIKYEDDVTEELKQSRVSEIMKIQQEISAELNENLVGRTMKVLVDRREGDYFVGRTEYDSPEVDQEVLIPVEYKIKPGNFYQVNITQSTDFDLFGKPVISDGS
ncbi:MAG: ribosomal protein S12 methylthiotransferase RimO [Bacteroidetes bacterium RBG_13_43_22]|nr:MAG: ribosomal protein S12 methylthiotransferase RimO [Bacteroidetes bacterium RBG_13_43_22]